MTLKNFNYFLGILLISSLISSVFAEEKIDIWNNKNSTETTQTQKKDLPEKNDQLNLKAAGKISPSQNIKIEDSLSLKEEENKVFGIYDPSDFNFNLNMWSSTNAEDIKSSIQDTSNCKAARSIDFFYDNQETNNILLEKSLIILI